METILDPINVLYAFCVIVLAVAVLLIIKLKKNFYKFRNYDRMFLVTKKNLGRGKYLISVDDEGEKTIMAECVEEGLNDGTVVFIEKVKGKYRINEYLSRIDPNYEKAKAKKCTEQEKKPSESVS
jgi:hypothetical protein